MGQKETKTCILTACNFPDAVPEQWRIIQHEDVMFAAQKTVGNSHSAGAQTVRKPGVISHTQPDLKRRGRWCVYMHYSRIASKCKINYLNNYMLQVHCYTINKKFPHVLWIPDVYHHIHSHPPQDLFLNQLHHPTSSCPVSLRSVLIFSLNIPLRF
jgi:hypothetical protein